MKKLSLVCALLIGLISKGEAQLYTAISSPQDFYAIIHVVDGSGTEVGVTNPISMPGGSGGGLVNTSAPGFWATDPSMCSCSWYWYYADVYDACVSSPGGILPPVGTAPGPGPYSTFDEVNIGSLVPNSFCGEGFLVSHSCLNPLAVTNSFLATLQTDTTGTIAYLSVSY